MLRARSLVSRLAVGRALSCVADTSLAKNFGVNLFSRSEQEKHISGSALDNIDEAVAEGKPISPDDADAYARGLMDWGLERGASHFAHWFHPLTGGSAQKHLAFFKRRKSDVIPYFSGKMLAISEPDGSSFPNGDLRGTHQARGYTVWDPTSTPFLSGHGVGSTVMVPSMFFSWKGHALDYKIPLLRSEKALSDVGKKLFKALHMKEHKLLRSDCGAEQEFFLIDRDYYLKRPDLVSCGRTLLGASPPKGQSLSDQYFADMSSRFLDCINDAEVEMWKVGIPQTTRHREVAPGQYEVAPIFSSSNVACDQNLILMELFARVGRKHNIKVLLHEKPFAHLNGSGKHNNWSVGTNAIGTVFQPGPDPSKNRLFLTFTIATLRSVHLHGDLLRLAISGAGNDHRLGGHEAPPAIMSVYLGDTVFDALASFGNNTPLGTPVSTKVDLGVAGVPTFERDPTDRNRTSPMAFTGNKFEFRAVGGSQHVARSSCILNAILADSLKYITDAVDKAAATKGAGVTHEAVIDGVLRDLYQKHKAIIFEGNGYSDEWKQEAKRRGLPSFPTTADVLPEFSSKKNVDLLSSLGILSEEEIIGHRDVMFGEYITKLSNEAACLSGLYNQYVSPAAFQTQTAVSASLAALGAAKVAPSPQQTALLSALTANLNAGLQAAAELQSVIAELESLSSSSLEAQAKFAQGKLKAAMANVRAAADTTETLVPASAWTLPTYHQMLFHQE